MMQDDPSQPGYGLPMGGYGDYESAYTSQRASYGAIPQGMMMGGYTVGAGAFQGMNNMLADVGRAIRPIGYTPPARVMAGYGGMYVQQSGLLSGAARYAGFGDTPRGVTEYEYNYYTASDLGERIAGGVTSATATAGGLAFAVYGGGNALMRGVGTFAGSALGAGGARVGGALGGLLGGYALGMWAAGEVQEGVSQRREIQNFLENSAFRFATSSFGQADPRFGSGMSVAARQQTADFVRQMDIKDPTFNTQELTQVLQQSAQLGMFQGTKDVKEFQQKFKDIVESVRVVSKTLHQTLEDGLKTIKDLKAIGYDPAEVKALVLDADARGKMAGRTGLEMVQMGLQGAEMFRGTGVEMRIGYQANVMGLAAIRAARDAGELSQEAIAQAGGEEALAQRMTATGLGFAQSAMGRGFGAAFFQAGQGFDPRSFQQSILQGQGFSDLTMQAAKNISDPRKIVEYQANQAKFVSEMGKQYGGQGLQIAQLGALTSQARFLVQTGAASNEADAMKYVMLNMGMSQSEVDASMAMIKNAPQTFEAAQRAAQATQQKMVYEQAVMSSPLNRIGAKVGDVVTGTADFFAKPLSRVADDVKTGLTDFIHTSYYGVRSADVGRLGEGRVTTSELFPGTKTTAGPIDLDKGRLLGDTFGENLADRILSGDLEAALGRSIGRRTAQAGAGDVILDTNRLDWNSNQARFRRGAGTTLAVSQEELDRAAKEARVILSIEAKSAEAKASDPVLDAARKGARSIIGRNVDASTLTFPDLVKQMTGKSDTMQLTPEEMSAVKKAAGEFPELQGVVDRSLNAMRSLTPISTAVYVEGVKSVEEKMKGAVGRAEIASLGADVLGGIPGMGMELLDKMGVRGHIDPAATKDLLKPATILESNRRLAERYRAQAKADPSRAAELEAKAAEAEAASQAAKEDIVSKLAARGVTSGEARERYLQNIRGISNEDLNALVGGFKDLQNLHQSLGTGQQADLARSAVATLKGDKLALAQGFLTRYEESAQRGLIMATPDELAAMRDAGGFAGILAAKAEGAKKLSGGQVSADEARKIVERDLPNIGKSMQEQVVQASQGRGDIKGVLEQAIPMQIQAETSGKQTVGGGAGTLGDTGADTAMRTQTEINQQILVALQAISSQLRLGR